MRCEIIAEIGSTHGGSLDNALSLIDAAKGAGATGVKFQCFDPIRLAIKRNDHPRIPSVIKSQKITLPLDELYRRINMPQEWFPAMIDRAKDKGLTWHSSAFSPEDVEFLESIDCPRYKIASFEAYDQPLRDAVTRTLKPVIMSANQSDDVIPLQDWMVLHATDYAVPPEAANIGRLRLWSRDSARFFTHHWKWGLSDHTYSSLCSEIAVTLGASMIEWHLSLVDVSSPDDEFSLTPWLFSERVHKIRRIESVLIGR